MSTAAAYLLVGASWVVTVAVVIALAVALSRHRKESERTSDELAAMQEQLAALRARVESLTTTVADLRHLSESQRAIASSASDKSNGVPVITGMSEADDVDLSATRVASVTLSGPLIKAAAFSHGVRHALHEEQRMRISYAMRKELRRQRKMRRRRRAHRSRSEGWVP
jgi:alkylation response protein AidB-like acyl-CoA dehydrogenase